MVHKEARVSCSAAAATRCQNGEEGKECHCACAGANHGLYKTIPDFEGVKITGYNIELKLWDGVLDGTVDGSAI
jgi:hypothetical protein